MRAAPVKSRQESPFSTKIQIFWSFSCIDSTGVGARTKINVFNPKWSNNLVTVHLQSIYLHAGQDRPVLFHFHRIWRVNEADFHEIHQWKGKKIHVPPFF